MGISDSVVSLIITEWLPYMYWYVYECMYPLTVQLYSPVAAAARRVLRPSRGPRLAIFIQTCNAFLPQYNSETAGLLATKFGMALGIHLKNLPHMMRPRPSASVVALAPLQRREGCGNTIV